MQGRGSMKNSKKCFLTATAAILIGMHAYNKFVETTATRKKMLSEEKGSFFDWKQGYIYYTKTGAGNPLLLVHDINSASSSEEWSKIIKRLSKNNTVYALDLLGCGRSEKPALKYTNYLYEQLITTFIKNVIKEPADVVATNLSSSVILMANAIDENLFKKIIFINPVSVKEMSKIPDTTGKIKQTIMNMPLVGTFAYNLSMTPLKIDFRFRNKYYGKQDLITTKIEDTYYEAAHYDKSNGRFLQSSLISNYVNINIKNALKNTKKTIYIIESGKNKENVKTLEAYHSINSNIQTINLPGGGLYPQLELPEKTASIIKSIIK